MPETPVSALSSRQRKLIENARKALDVGNLEYAIEACGRVLSAEPGCLEVRRLLRTAQLQRFEAKNRTLAKALGSLSSTPFIFSSATKDPLKSLSSAEKILATDPTSTAALKLLAEAAAALEFRETVAFAREAVRDLAPDDAENLHALADAWLACGRANDAVTVADELIRLRPLDTAAQDLVRKAAVAQSASQGGWAVPEAANDTTLPEVPAASLPEDVEAIRSQLTRDLQLVEEEPDHLPHYRAIIEAYRKLGRPNDALAWTRGARARPSGTTDLGFARWESELEGEVLELQLKAAESARLTAPTDPEVLARIDAAQRELASFRLFEARRVAELNPNDIQARLALARTCLDSGRPDEAVTHFQAAVNDPEVRTSALIGLGRAYRLLEQPDAAAAQFILAKAELGPMDDRKKEVTYHLAECYEALEKPAEAIAEYKAIYASDIEYRDVAARINAFFSKGGGPHPVLRDQPG